MFDFWAHPWCTLKSLVKYTYLHEERAEEKERVPSKIARYLLIIYIIIIITVESEILNQRNDLITDLIISDSSCCPPEWNSDDVEEWARVLFNAIVNADESEWVTWGKGVWHAEGETHPSTRSWWCAWNNRLLWFVKCSIIVSLLLLLCFVLVVA